MRQLSRIDRAAMHALENAIEHEPALRPVLVSDYAISRKEVLLLRDTLHRLRSSFSRHPDEPGSKTALRYRDGLAPYGTEDFTGFAGEPGTVF